MKKLRSIIPTTNHMPTKPRLTANPIRRFNNITATPMHKTRMSGIGQAVQFRGTSSLRAAMTDLYHTGGSNAPLSRFKGLERRSVGSIEDHPLHPNDMTMGHQRAMMSVPRTPKFAKHRIVW